MVGAALEPAAAFFCRFCYNFVLFHPPFLTLYILLEPLWGAVIGMIYNPTLMITKVRPDDDEEEDEEDDEDDDFDDDFEDDEEE